VIYFMAATISIFASVSVFGQSCFVEAGKTYNINPRLLRAISKVESKHNSKAININSNGTIDYGMMQINSFWGKKLKSFGIKTADLFDSCTNVYVGAWILAQSIQKFGNTWEAVGAYNAGTGVSLLAKQKRLKYASIVYRTYYSRRL